MGARQVIGVIATIGTTITLILRIIRRMTGQLPAEPIPRIHLGLGHKRRWVKEAFSKEPLRGKHGLMAAKKATKSDQPKSAAPADYEKAVSQVESIVRALESGELGLTESLEHYEQGVACLKDCHTILSEAEQKISLLSGFDADGNPITEPLPPTQFRSGGDTTNPSGSGGRKRTLKRRKVDDRTSNMDDTSELF